MYELGIKLHEANFPYKGLCFGIKIDGKPLTIGDKDKDIDFVEFPTLNELIEACGDNLESIIHRGNGDGDNWEVRSKNERFNATTIEEAVTKLWLELNKK